MPEAVYCADKTSEQVAAIAAAVRARPDVVTLFTRADHTHAKAVLSKLPHAFHDIDGALLAWPPVPPEPVGGLVVVVAAATSDLPVAEPLSAAGWQPAHGAERCLGLLVVGNRTPAGSAGSAARSTHLRAPAGACT
jgi:NCAIR mutase (PurE)-related protein